MREADEAVRHLAERLARLNDVHVDVAERAVRSLVARGLIELKLRPISSGNCHSRS